MDLLFVGSPGINFNKFQSTQSFLYMEILCRISTINCPFYPVSIIQRKHWTRMYIYYDMLSSSIALTDYRSSRCDLRWTGFALNVILIDTCEHWSIQQYDLLSMFESREVICVHRKFYNSHVIGLVEWINIWIWIRTELSQRKEDLFMISLGIYIYMTWVHKHI